MTFNLSSLSLSLSPLGNDLEALQIHLCFCLSNLHPRRAASFGSTLVSAVSNIYLSQQTGRGESGSCWRLQTSRQRYRPLPAESCFVWMIEDGLDLSPLSATSPASARDETKLLISAFTNFFLFYYPHFSSVLLTSVSFSLDLFFSSQPFKGFFFTFIGVGWLHIYICTYIYVYSLYTV